MQPRRKGDSVVGRNRVCSDCRLQKMKSLPEADTDTLCPFAVIPSFESRKMVVHVKKPSYEIIHFPIVLFLLDELESGQSDFKHYGT